MRGYSDNRGNYMICFPKRKKEVKKDQVGNVESLPPGGAMKLKYLEKTTILDGVGGGEQ